MLTTAGLDKLKESMPHADFTDFEQNPDVSKMSNLFTVRTIINYVEAKLKSASASPA